MAYITGFSITGLVGRESDYSQELNRHTNVFFGLNGSGKTSLLKILDSALSGETTLIARVPFREAIVSIFSEDYKKKYTLKLKQAERSKTQHRTKIAPGIQRVSFPSNHPMSEQYPHDAAVWTTYGDVLIEDAWRWTYTPALPKGAGGSWRHTYLPTWRFFSGADDRRHKRTREYESDWDQYFADRIKALWSEYSNKMLSEVQQIQAKGLADILLSILAKPKTTGRKPKTLAATIAYEQVAAFLQRVQPRSTFGSKESFAKRYAEEEQLRSTVADINRIEQHIERATASRKELQSLITAMFSGKHVEFRTSGIAIKTQNGEEISLSSLSSGEKQALELFIEALRVDSGSLLIDEPEISLHIDWQTKLVGAMRQLNPGAQLILATHSPEIMATLPDNEIFRL